MPEVQAASLTVQDGRDVPDGTSVKFVEQLEKDLEALQGCDAKIASGGGRMYVTMDRYEVTGACLRTSAPILLPVKADGMAKSATGRVSQPMQGTCHVSALGAVRGGCKAPSGMQVQGNARAGGLEDCGARLARACAGRGGAQVSVGAGSHQEAQGETELPHLALDSPHPSLMRSPESTAQHCNFNCMPS